MKKRIFQNNEGISPVLGFILILAIGVSLLTTVQLSFVPVWNTQEELDHIKLMQDDLKVLKSNIESGIQSGTTLSSPLTMGFKYSPKMFVYNPRDEAYASLDISNNTWVEVRYNEVFPEGMTDETSIKNIRTGMITYALRGAQNYNSFIYENGLIRRSGSNYTTNSQNVLANNTIFLPSLKALDYGITSGVEKRTVNIYPTSQQKNSVIGQNVWLILHTDPDYVDWWENNLKNEGATVRKKDATNGIVIANISSSVVIKMGEAYISTSQKTSPPHSPAKRIVKVSGTGTSLPVGGTTSITVEVQDEYNNPVPNVLVSFSPNMSTTGHPSNSNTGDDISPYSAVSGSDGRASVTLTANDAGFYYIDASMTDYKTTIVYSASSQGSVLKLDPPTGSYPEYNLIATLTDSLGNPPPSTSVTFDTSDGNFTSLNPNNTVSGKASIVLNVSNANGTKITNIQVKNTTSNTTNITWNTNNNITVTAKSGYVFNSRIVPTDVSTTGCVFYGTSPGNYFPTPVCDNNPAFSHSVPLTGLSSYTAYYFIVNSSRSGGSGVNSTEYMFVTEGTGEITGDVTPPASVTNLQNVTGSLFIRWTWTDPADADFKNVEIKIDDGATIYTVNKGIQSFNATYLMPNSSHNISIRTVDTSGNPNATWVTQNASTTSLLTYVFNFTISSDQGNVALWSNAQSDADSGAAALFNKTSSSVTSARDNYTNVTGNTTTVGSISNWANLQIGGAFANFTEGGSGGSPGGRVNITVNVIGASDNTGDTLAALQADDTSGASPGSVSTIDNWYTVIKNKVMYIDGFNTSGISGSITSATLRLQYSVQSTSPVYSGTNNVTWGREGAALNATDINPLDGHVDVIRSFDLFARGINTVAMLSTLNIEFSNNDGGATTSVSFDYVWIDVTYSGVSTTYSMNITTYTDPVPADTNYFLEIRYRIDTNETGYNVSVFNGSGWAFKGTLTSNTWADFNQSLDSSEYNSGKVSVRYADLNLSGTSRGNLSIDYQRIHGYTPAIAGGYYLDVTTNTTGIPSAASQVLQVRYNVSVNEDNFTLQIKNSSTSLWDDRAILNQTTMNLLNITLQPDYLFPDGAFSTGSVSDLSRYYMLVRYLSINSSKQGKVYLDYQRLNSS